MGFFKSIKKAVKKAVKKVTKVPRKIVKEAKRTASKVNEVQKKAVKETVEGMKRIQPLGNEGYLTKTKREIGRGVAKLSGAEAIEEQTAATERANQAAIRANADARRSEVFAQTSGGGAGQFGSIALGVDEDEEEEAFRLGKSTLQL